LLAFQLLVWSYFIRSIWIHSLALLLACYPLDSRSNLILSFLQFHERNEISVTDKTSMALNGQQRAAIRAVMAGACRIRGDWQVSHSIQWPWVVINSDQIELPLS
jgi:hypothetical protein